VQAIGPATTTGHRFRVDYTTVDGSDYRVATGAGAIEAKVVVLAAGTMGTPVIGDPPALRPRAGRRPGRGGALLLAQR
jgi:hypothetical protein